MKIALVHDYLLRMGGAERTLKVLQEIFPEAPIFTLFYNKNFVKKFLPDSKIISSFIQKFPKVNKLYKWLLPFYPIAIESFDLKDYDLVISSNICFSKGLVLKPTTKHICYCYSPTRWLWDWNKEYLKNDYGSKKRSVRVLQHLLRLWDKSASSRPDVIVAISKNVQQRIYKYYKRESKIIYPPVYIEPTSVEHKTEEEYFLIVSQLFSHKNIDIAIKAFEKLNWKLIVIGNGPEYGRLKAKAGKLTNIKLLKSIGDEELAHYYQDCLGLIMPQEEDFGLTSVEAMSFGKPVLGLRKGGATETIIEGITGEFFEDPNPTVLAEGIRRMYDKIKIGYFSPLVIKKHSEKFSKQRFINEIKQLVSNE